MKFKLVWVAAAISALVCGITDAEALQYDRIELAGSQKILLLAQGHIDSGDTLRFMSFFMGLPKSARIAGLVLDSPGGSLLEAEALAGVVRRGALPVLVPPGGQCSSACFLMFAAAPHRLVAVNARIGLHRASEYGRETIGAKAATAALVKDIDELGVPRGIASKLLQTPPDRQAWLTAGELSEMGVSIIGGRQLAPTWAPPTRAAIETWLTELHAR